jgi:hypothetical protein
MRDMIEFLEDLIREDESRTRLEQKQGSGTNRGRREVELKRAVLDLHRPRHDGHTWVCDACTHYDTLRRTVVRIYAPCDQLAALAKVYEEEPGFEADWIPEEAQS